jgi:hypothetical protein
LSSQPSTPVDITPFLFPEGWQAAQLSPTGEVSATPEVARLEAIAQQVVPAGAVSLDRVYPARIRLLAYRLEPSQPRPGDDIELTLYWQAATGRSEPVQLIVQLADSRSIELGRSDSQLPPPEQARWLPGEVIATDHRFSLAASLEAPLAGQIEVRLKDQANIFLDPSTLAGEKAEPVIARFTVAPPAWPTATNATPAEAIWQSESGREVALRGYTLAQTGQELLVGLLWEARQPLTEDYTVFVHMLDEAGQIVSQNDSLPRAGAYPTLWWQPGQVVEDGHSLFLPEDLPAGDYRLVVGLYRSEGGQRLLRADGSDAFVVETVEIQR